MIQEDIQSFEYNPTQEKIVKILQNKTQSKEELFFRVVTIYYLSQISSMMRTTIDTEINGVIPTNSYILGLATSGFGLK